MEETKHSRIKANNSSFSLSEKNLPASSPKQLKRVTIRNSLIMKKEKKPSFERFLRANTRINTNMTEQGNNQFLIPDLEILNPKKNSSKGKFEDSFDKKKELLQNYIKVRETTPYEIIEEKSFKNFEYLIKGLLNIKVAVSELCRVIIKNTIFETFIIIVILANTVTLALDTIYYIPSNLDTVYLSIYTAECGIKIFALGLFRSPGSYIRNK